MEAERFMVEDLLNFTLDVCEEVEDDENDKTTLKPPSSSSPELLSQSTQDPDEHQSLSPEGAEEELEWLLNKDAFPSVETCFELLSDNPGIVLNHQSPVSVLESTTASATTTSNSNSNSNSHSSSIMTCPVSFFVPGCYPVKARSKRRLRRRRGFSDLSSQQWWNQPKVKNGKKELPRLPPAPASATKIGRRCQHCQVDKTPQWRAGPMGPKTLCNACGVRYKSGRLVPEYRPACSPTFSSLLHSNSHRKVMEMRKQKEMGGGGMTVANGAC